MSIFSEPKITYWTSLRHFASSLNRSYPHLIYNDFFNINCSYLDWCVNQIALTIWWYNTIQLQINARCKCKETAYDRSFDIFVASHSRIEWSVVLIFCLKCELMTKESLTCAKSDRPVQSISIHLMLIISVDLPSPIN